MSNIVLAIFVALAIPFSASAQSGKGKNLLAVGQGIAIPSLTTIVNLASGTVHQNPSGAAQEDTLRFTGHYTQGGNSSAIGMEAGIGGSGWGAAIGHYKQDCDLCEGSTAGVLGLDLGGMGFGIRAMEDLYGIGLVINTKGSQRLGIVGEFYEASSDTKVNNIGVGYGWVGSKVSFVIDASKRIVDNPNVDDDAIFLTPGLLFTVDIVQLSLNYETVLNNNSSNDDNGDFAFGMGIDKKPFHFAFYGDFFSETAFTFSYFF